MRITKEDDILSDHGTKKVINAMKGSYAMWISIPCTGGSSWQAVNLKRGASTRKLIAGHWSLFRKLWSTISELAALAIKEGRPVYIEWPRYCRYWSENKVKQFIKRFRGVQLDLDGCQYGVVSNQNRSRGEPILKPWRILGFNCTPTAGLQLRCPKVHKHTPAEGSDTKRTEEYPIALVRAIHLQIANDCRACGTTIPDSCPVAYPSRGIMS